MFNTIRQWLTSSLASCPSTISSRRTKTWASPLRLPERPTSVVTDPGFGAWNLTPDGEGLFPPPEGDPASIFSMLRWLRDYVPDVSAGIWAWVRLCSTQQTVSLSDGDVRQRERARGVLLDLDRRLYGAPGARLRGIEALMQDFFLSLFTYGRFCGEVIVNEERDRLERFIVIDPATVRFRLDPITRRFVPLQALNDGTLIALNPASFFYHGLDTDGLSPYGRSPLLALPLVIRAQRQLLNDMGRAMRNAGYPTLHFRIKPANREPGEAMDAYHDRLSRELDDLRGQLVCKQPEDNLITYDHIEVNYVSPSGRRLQWSDSLQAISEQVISALHLAPFMIGRNWGTTQSWGNAQYQLICNNARSVQRGAARLAEWLCNLELALQGSPVTVQRQFAPHHHLDIAERAQAYRLYTQSLLKLAQEGVLDSAALRERVAELDRLM